MIRRLLVLIMFLSFTSSLSAQTKYPQVSSAVGNEAIENIKLIFPKFYQEYQLIKNKDQLIKEFVFINEKGVGPAFASPNGIITINLEFLNKTKPAFDDNRLIVVLYHEVGHLHYYALKAKKEWNPEDSEKAAFEYSLAKTKEMAENKDCLPLKAGLKFMKLRSESNDLKDPHVRALKRMVNEPLYAAYLKYITANCKD